VVRKPTAQRKAVLTGGLRSNQLRYCNISAERHARIERLGSWLDALSLHRLSTAGTSDNRQVFWRFGAHALTRDRGSANLAVLLGVNMATLRPTAP
jgi:hypothetical protein